MACGTEGGRLAYDRGLPVFSVHMKQGFIYLFQELNPISKTLSHASIADPPEGEAMPLRANASRIFPRLSPFIKVMENESTMLASVGLITSSPA